MDGTRTMENFTPVESAAGGMLIGLAVVMLWLGLGRIAGISGIVGGIFTAKPNETGWRVAFVLGLLAAPLALSATGVFSASAPAPVTGSTGLLIVAGLLVGFGT